MNTIYKNIILGLIIIAAVTLGVLGIYTLGKNVGYAQKSAEVLKEQLELVQERDKFKAELELFKIASKKVIEVKIADAEKAYLDGVDYGKAQVDSIIDDLPNNGLSINVTTDSTSGSCSAGNTTNTASNTETKRAKLSKEDAAFLIAFSNEADDTARQLAACQKSLTEVMDYLNKWTGKKF